MFTTPRPRAQRAALNRRPREFCGARCRQAAHRRELRDRGKVSGPDTKGQFRDATKSADPRAVEAPIVHLLGSGCPLEGPRARSGDCRQNHPKRTWRRHAPFSSRKVTTMAKSLKVREAIKLLRKPGSRLVLTNNAGAREFFVVPGGKVTEKSAKRILSLRACRSVDRGLWVETAQSWALTPDN